MSPSPHVYKPLVQRLKIMADIEIWTPNQALQGCTFVKTNDREHSLRVQTTPSEFGETMTILFEPETE